MTVRQVQGLEIDQDQPGAIRLRIGVLPDTPITKGTWAEISTQGVTGISNIDLRDDGKQPRESVHLKRNPTLSPCALVFFRNYKNQAWACSRTARWCSIIWTNS